MIYGVTHTYERMTKTLMICGAVCFLLVFSCFLVIRYAKNPKEDRVTFSRFSFDTSSLLLLSTLLLPVLRYYSVTLQPGR